MTETPDLKTLTKTCAYLPKLVITSTLSPRAIYQVNFIGFKTVHSV